MITWIILAALIVFASIKLALIQRKRRSRQVSSDQVGKNLQIQVSVAEGHPPMTAYKRDEWKQFGYSLDRFDSSLKNIKYPGAFEPPEADFRTSWNLRDLPNKGITPEQIKDILSETAIAPPHGFQLLDPCAIPKIPDFPAYPTEPQPQWQTYTAERAEKMKLKREQLVGAFQRKSHAEIAQLAKLKQGCCNRDPAAIRIMMVTSHIRHPLAPPLRREFDVEIDFVNRIALCTVEIPDFAALLVVNKRGTTSKAKWLPVSIAERRRSIATLLYALCIRASYLTACSDAGDWFDTVAVNAVQSWRDPATGEQRNGFIASLQVGKGELLRLHIGQLDPKTCFRHLKGITTPSVDEVSPIRPILVLNTQDGRIIENRDVADKLDREANLAAMPWEDFEQLVRQLFEWEFGRNGVEVKVTRASRDRGVDAIMFDPDPLRGGKYVLQAKRYTRSVDVAAVRDLYGTVMNEGANRGILVTTSSFGPDSYEFAKDKPISLVDGPNLIAMLKRHGRGFRIDLAEARRLETENSIL